MHYFTPDFLKKAGSLLVSRTSKRKNNFYRITIDVTIRRYYL